jgi:hypothetical protein
VAISGPFDPHCGSDDLQLHLLSQMTNIDPAAVLLALIFRQYIGHSANGRTSRSFEVLRVYTSAIAYDS